MWETVQCLSQMEIIQTPISHLPEGCPNHRTRNEKPLRSLKQQPCCSCIKASPHLSPWTTTAAIRLFSTVWQGAQISKFRFTNAFWGIIRISMLLRDLGEPLRSLDITRHPVPCSSWCGCLCACVSLVCLHNLPCSGEWDGVWYWICIRDTWIWAHGNLHRSPVEQTERLSGWHSRVPCIL